MVNLNKCDNIECGIIGINLGKNCVYAGQSILRTIQGEGCVEISECGDCEYVFGTNCNEASCNKISDNLKGVSCIYDKERAVQVVFDSIPFSPSANIYSGCYPVQSCEECGGSPFTDKNICDEKECAQISRQLDGSAWSV